MPKLLTPEQVETYKGKGHASPMRAMPAEEALDLRGQLEKTEAELGRPLNYEEKLKPYLLFPWADKVVHHPRVLDAVEDVIGPNILLFMTTLWIKEPRTDAYVMWHQDGPYFQLEPTEQVTAWVALSEASIEAGCVRVMPGTNAGGEIPHGDYSSPNYLIRRGFGIHPDHFGSEEGVPMPLHAGEMSLHNTLTAHASGPNRSDDRRIGLGVSYIPTHVKPLGDMKPPAMLVRGQDTFGHYQLERRLGVGESDLTARGNHAWALGKYSERQKSNSKQVVV